MTDLTIPLSLTDVQDLLDSAHPTEQEHIQRHAVQLAQQLLATMQENAMLLNLVKELHTSMNGEAGCHYRESDLGERAEELLNASEYRNTAEQPPARAEREV